MGDLDEATKKALNELTFEEINNSKFQHEVMEYGISAVVINQIMKRLMDVPARKISIDDFLEKYEIKRFKLDMVDKHAFFVFYKTIENDGIFFPKFAYWNNKGDVIEPKAELFDNDYGNKFLASQILTGKDYAYAWELMGLELEKKDLENPEIIRQGVIFGRDMFELCALEFERYKDNFSEKVKRLGGELIGYYTEVVGC